MVIPTIIFIIMHFRLSYHQCLEKPFVINFNFSELNFIIITITIFNFFKNCHWQTGIIKLFFFKHFNILMVTQQQDHLLYFNCVSLAGCCCLKHFTKRVIDLKANFTQHLIIIIQVFIRLNIISFLIKLVMVKINFEIIVKASYYSFKVWGIIE